MARPRKDMSPDLLALLAYLRQAAPGPRSASFASLPNVADALGCSVGKVKQLRASALAEGLLEMEERWGENGARLENAYRLTRKGRRMLASRKEELEALPK